MASLEELRNERIKKKEQLEQSGMDPYPVVANRDIRIADVHERFEQGEEEQAGNVWIAGRVRTLRRQGGLAFAVLDDGSGELQAFLERDALGEEHFALLTETVDIGDFIEVTGTLGYTKRGERSVMATAWRMLAKSLRPLPDKWHGLVDAEERFRRRYLDLIMSEDARARFRLRSRVVSYIRSFLDGEDFLEVETPALQPLYGGASAEPFVTHHNALDVDLYLRISDELYLKRLLVGGFPKVYEICKDFRNEGIDATHYPEFTMLEFYESFADARRGREITERLIRGIVQEVLQSDTVVYDGNTIDFNEPFSVITYSELLEQYTGVAGLVDMDKDALRGEAEKLGVSVAPADGKAKMLDTIYKKTCRPHVIQPTFIIKYPKEMIPLAKADPEHTAVSDVTQLVAGGIELVKAYSELNDPQEQRQRFLKEEEQAEAGDAEAQQLDEDFLGSLEYGMPPASGVGIGIDRLMMFLSDAGNIKETILFPTMRPRQSE